MKTLLPLKEESRVRTVRRTEQAYMNLSFFERHFGTLIIVGAMTIAQVAEYAILQARVAALEGEQKNSITSVQHEDLTRRVVALESEVVPRSEHLLRDEQLSLRLKNIEDQLHVMNENLVDIQASQRKSKN